jgi:hypothetical protein
VAVSTGVIVGLIWIGFAAHRPTTAAITTALIERISTLRHRRTEGRSRMASPAVPDVVVIVLDDIGWRDVATRHLALQQSMTRQIPGVELAGSSR